MNLIFFFSVPVTLAAAAVLSANSDFNVSEVKKAFDSAHVRIIIPLKTTK